MVVTIRDKRPESLPYGLITEELIEWWADNLLAVVHQAPSVEERRILIIIALWSVSFESTHVDRGNEVGVPDPKIIELFNDLQLRLKGMKK
jgi:hypothetical protein